ncbi:cation:proton antiporter domain-containing protein [Candidatus Cetobacterium colombiensis]|uniref:Cation:proton antiporter n=1 Tax=Candidatus Cetobacterium colombiensis TaxID=3073100 RepID=A0ABU4WEC9_9FUSO|nr:cation:proton antiporter [Candidatus Cetobacterium colombiensis]MDX8336848.1 cation:proton antiporter [Candidatus Cetobacterium colombiensis]
MISIDEGNIFYLLLQLSIIFILTNLINGILKKINQPTITGDLVVGIILGPTILGTFFPNLYKAIFPQNLVQIAMLDTLSWFGLFLVLLSTGIEVDFSSIWKQRKNAMIISSLDVIIPIIFSMFFIYFLPNEYFEFSDNKFITTFFISVIMTISALPIAIRALREVGIMKSNLGFLIISALTINDIIGWIVFTLLLSLFSMKFFDWKIAIEIILYTGIFTFLALNLGKKIVNWLFSKVINQDSEGIQGVLAVLISTGIVFGLITLEIGIHTLFGFFIAGIVAGDSPIFTKSARNTVHNFVYSVFASLFFVNIGLKINFFENFNLLLSLFITLIGILGRYLGAWIGSVLSKNRKYKNIIAIAHTPGGEMHIVVSLIALSFGLLSKELFVAIVFAAILSSILVGPWLAYAAKSFKILDKLEVLVYPNMKIEAKTKDEAIEKMLEFVNLKDKKNYIIKNILEKEEEICSGLKNGISVPRGIVDDLEETKIIFAKLENPINWNSLDGKYVRYIFLILTSKKNEETQIAAVKKITQISKNCLEADELNLLNTTEELERYIKNYIAS